MYFWRTDRLVAEINSQSLSENDYKNYYLATTLVTLFSCYLLMVEPPREILASSVEMIATMAITVTGINAAFSANGGGTGSRFIEKALTISFPLTIKVLLAAFVLSLPIGVAGVGFGATLEQLDWVGVCVNVAIQGVFFWRLVVFMRKVADHG